MVCLDVCSEARYWTFGWSEPRMPGLRVFGWSGYSCGVFGLDIESWVRTAKNQEARCLASPLDIPRYSGCVPLRGTPHTPLARKECILSSAGVLAAAAQALRPPSPPGHGVVGLPPRCTPWRVSSPPLWCSSLCRCGSRLSRAPASTAVSASATCRVTYKGDEVKMGHKIDALLVYLVLGTDGWGKYASNLVYWILRVLVQVNQFQSCTYYLVYWRLREIRSSHLYNYSLNGAQNIFRCYINILIRC